MRTLLLLLAVLCVAGRALAASELEALLARAQAGDMAAEQELRLKIAAGEGAVEQLGQVADLFRKTAIKGDVNSQYTLAFMFEQGLGIPRDYRQAESWYLRAAKQGLLAAQYRLGLMYYEGRAVGPDRKRGFIWLTVAAERGAKEAVFPSKRAEATLAPDDLAEARTEAATILREMLEKPTTVP